ncbi:hypothetical protein PV08_11027 [Exophiala spinifera]|uniref:L-dopachrome isomerase n=1 Tax=Exophiala spinifera TaxID=91928 RepID=A0A0D2AZ27_9EURO|nr:uncharacterized protein PV08_11027 [Exophiala spinifera]KIW11725.1 hypothetical protein PV08_11027 [Exophiala spinifera]
MTSTPASSNQINAMTVENVFPTPPTGQPDAGTLFRLKRTLSPPPKRLLPRERAQSTPPETTRSNQFGILTKGTDGQWPDMASLESSWQRLHLSKKKSQYFEGAFAYREPNNTAKERILKDSVVLAEIRLNYSLDSEKEFLIDLSFRLSEIYQRPESCIMVLMTTDVSMLLGGNSEPAYHLMITALPSEIAATKNKRSTRLLQDFILDTLQIPQGRGVVQFQAVTEENLATNGMTALQEIEQLERQPPEEDGRFTAVSRQSRRSKKSTGPALTERIKSSIPSLRSTTPSRQQYNTVHLGESKSTEASGLGRKRVKRRQSILAFFKR